MTGLEAFVIPALVGAGEAVSAAPLTTALSVASTGLGVAGAVGSANAQSAGLKAQAQQDQAKAGAERAAASAKAEQENKKKEALLSAQQARFGASGGGTTGTAAEVMGDTAAQGNYNAEMQLWSGNEKANGYIDDANQKLADAGNVQSALPLQIGSQIITGASKFAGKMPSYGGDGPMIDASYDPDSGFMTTTRSAAPQYRYG